MIESLGDPDWMGQLTSGFCLQLVRTFTDYDATVGEFEAAHLKLLEEAGK
jgi:hypothetical protein